ncbi:hypothetical protein ABZ897_27530 [Nonomuraea sp. NPDC046802]|uniref:hypothetical protein n=1 Tax=Nonomuraea sp. NPDC046802 TaxID=3154919 RepID=UPI0034002FF9
MKLTRLVGKYPWMETFSRGRCGSPAWERSGLLVTVVLFALATLVAWGRFGPYTG